MRSPAEVPRRTASRWRPLTIGVGLIVAALAFGIGASAEKARGAETSVPNNLSFPVIWGDGAMLTLPGDQNAAPTLTTSVDVDGTVLYPQGIEPPGTNIWQAENVVPTDPVDVSQIDWGDNVESRTLSGGKPIRVETTLIQDLPSGTTMTAYPMQHVSGAQSSEVFGTTGVPFESNQATVYSACARLTIQRLLISRDDPAVSLMKWDATTGEWTGTNIVASPLFNGGVWEGGEGTGYSAEVNGSGKVLYGYNWRTSGLADGDYRLTFSLDASCPAATLNTFITSATTIYVTPSEEAASVRAEPTGSVAKVDGADNLSYIDVEVGNPSYEPYVAPEEPPAPPEPPTPPAPAVVQPVAPPVITPSPGVKARTRATVTLRLRKFRRHGQMHYRFAGSVVPRHDGQKVRIRLRTRSGYRTVALARLHKVTRTRSQFRVTLHKVKRGWYSAYLAGDKQHLATASQRVWVRGS